MLFGMDYLCGICCIDLCKMNCYKHRFLVCKTPLPFYLSLSKVLDHQMAADVNEDIVSKFLYSLIIFKWQIYKDDLSKLFYLYW